VNRVVPDDRVEAEAYAIAGRIAEGAPLAARWHKRFVYDLVARRPLTAEERPAEPAQRQDLLLLTSWGAAISLAGFQLSTTGRYVECRLMLSGSGTKAANEPSERGDST
jgi:hypothetical protein